MKSSIFIKFLITIIITLGYNVKGFSQVTDVYNFTGGVQNFTVPACTDSLILTVCGAQGGGPTGGQGACIDVTIPVEQGDQIEIFVGGQGTCGNNSGGWNGGGTGHASTQANTGWNSCGGGGASEVHVNGVPVAIAGAGGGTGGGSTSTNQNSGGAGGCANGVNGGNTFGQGGQGASQNAGGNGGTPWAGTPPGGSNGALGQGGQGGFWQTASGGGGGGGYYGGGGGGNDGCCTGANGGGGGAGGSSLVPTGGNCTQGTNTGDGSVTITYVEGSFDVVVTNTSCLGASDGMIEVSTDSPNSQFSFDGGNTYSLTDSVLTDIPAGDYEVCVEFDGGQCSNACDSVTVEEGPPIGINAFGDTLICENGTAVISAEGLQGNTFTYAWEHTNETTASVNASPTDPTSYWVVATNELGCRSDTAFVDVDLFPPLDGVLTPDDYVCPGFEGSLTATGSGGNGGPYSYSWSGPGGGVISNDALMTDNPFNTSVYTVTITDDCESTPFSISGTIEVAPIPEIEFSVDEVEKCEPAIFTLTQESDLTNISNYTWILSTGDTITDLAQFDIAIPDVGGYDVTMGIQTVDGCFDTLSLEDFMFVRPQPTADFEYNPDPMGYLNPTAEFLNDSENADWYEWFFEQGSPSFSNEESPFVDYPIGEIGVYEATLVAHSDLGCSDTITKFVEVGPEVVLYVPNTFTPDNDGFNEQWRPYIDGIDVQKFHLLVFNRWGEVVWESYNPEASWDGNYGGMLVQEGTYVWRITAGDPNTDEKYEWQGHVNVLY
jgi:gliding motility-associated-like protein